MSPFYFGAEDRRLFGILTSPPDGSGATGAVLCPPLGQEAIATHRTLRLLADQLSTGGVHTLRFDYFGTGDSHGDTRDTVPEGWLEDIATAVEEMRRRTTVRRIHLVGLRLGAFLALAAEVRAVSGLVLWDPVVDVRDHVDALRAVAAGDPDGGWDIDGFWVPESLLEGLGRIGLSDVRRVPRDVLVITSAETPGLDGLQGLLEERRARVERERFESPPAWIQETDLGPGAIPTDLLARIAQWLS